MGTRFMIHPAGFALVTAGAVFVCAAATGPSRAEGTVPAPARSLIAGNCLSCHDASVFTARPIARDEWAGILQRMVGYKPELADIDLKTIEAGLSATYSAPRN